MGIQDRDYYWEKHKSASKSNASDFDQLLKRNKYSKKSDKQNSGGFKYLLMPALMLFGLWQGADRLLKQRTAHPPISPTISIPGGSEPVAIPISGGLEISADRQGHFRGTAYINGVPMPFLIDTGATITSIPSNLAYEARLPVGGQINADTAGGQVVDRLTKINHLKIGNAEIHNLDAAINQHLKEVLIGMNTLKYFNISQSGNTMTVVANGSSPEQITRAPIMPPSPVRPNILAAEQPIAKQEIKRPITIKRTVSCDANKICTTKYSDH